MNKDKKAKLAEFMHAVAETHRDADAKGLKKGHGGTGELPCPTCETGTIKYSVASVNGHIFGCCTTPGCVRWME